MGGALSSIEKGFMQNEIQEAAYQYQRALETKDATLVGVNAFQVNEKLEMERLKVNPSIEQNQRTRLAELRKNRDQAKVSELLTRLEQSAKGTDSMMPLFVECVENEITLGEITGVLRQVWGEYHAASWG
jgi:methylmalonyl-CoA mutase, N-terminal domain